MNTAAAHAQNFGIGPAPFPYGMLLHGPPFEPWTTPCHPLIVFTLIFILFVITFIVGGHQQIQQIQTIWRNYNYFAYSGLLQ